VSESDVPDWQPHTSEERLFAKRFAALTGNHPFRWQWRLFESFTRAAWPHQVDLPTGLGKTSVIGLWVLALGRALEMDAVPLPIPRRLAYVVDRRVVVDQASEEAETIVNRLKEAIEAQGDDVLHAVARRLQEAGCDDGVLALSALRGQRTLETTWRLDPARPAIIIGTVDMIGSRLLFSAYGRVGRWGRPYEAGLLAQDCLLVLDEAHLSQPFDDTLAAAEALVAQRPRIRPFAVIRMGATSRPCPADRWRFSLEEEDREPRVRRRLQAGKRLELRELREPSGSAAADLAQWTVEVARRAAERGEKPAIGLVLNTVRAARAAHLELRTRLGENSLDPEAVLVLTGSMRGIERDEIVSADRATPEACLYRRFRAGHTGNKDGPAFLVATSCIEVGADIDLDHLGTEACALDSLVQRLGRVNRRGERETSSIVRVLTGAVGLSDVPANISKWLGELRQQHPALALDGDALDGSPDGLPRTAAIALDESDDLRMRLCGAPEPVPFLSRATVDDLSMTSLAWEEADRPDVSLWLHGCAPDDEGGYVELGWRTELDWVTGERDAENLVDAFPLAPRETARCPLSEAVQLLQRLRSQRGQDAGHCLVLVRGDVARGHRIASLPDGDAELYSLAAWSQVALPCTAGGYKDHFVDPGSSGIVGDVADRAIPETWAPRRRLWISEGYLSAAPEPADGGLDVVEVVEAWLAEDAEELRAACEPAMRMLLGNAWDAIAAGGSAKRGVVVARQRRTRTIESADEDRASVGYRTPVTLSQHLEDAGRWAERLCKELGLGDVARAIIDAAKAHDLGKDRPWWQRAIGATSPPPLAKSGRSGFNHAANQRYRHELGSLFDLLRQGGRLDELVAHLVTTHHGYGRPTFAMEQAGPVRVLGAEHAIRDAALRFARLHQELGAWQLAYLEAVLKAADALASREVAS
jgi:CRISPR-associated endonuclease/helicase Cas3